LAVSAPWSLTSASGPSTAGFSFFRSGLAPLLNAQSWILQGTKLANGACRYRNVNTETEVPKGGWEERTIALDPTRCRKLVEAGTPTTLSAGSDEGMASLSAVATPPSPSGGNASAVQPNSIQSTQSAYIRIFWMDPINLKVNQDVTQINWTSNGTTVSNGSTNGFWNWLTTTHWQLLDDSATNAYGPGSTYFIGQTTSNFFNSWFCAPLPNVYTHYYDVRMWGHPNATATWAQASDTIDECAPFHWDKITAYGAFTGF
jgi:hypothetical protein